MISSVYSIDFILCLKLKYVCIHILQSSVQHLIQLVAFFQPLAVSPADLAWEALQEQHCWACSLVGIAMT